MDEEECEQPKDPDDEDAPIRNDEPELHQDVCQSCNSPTLDLGKEAADEYRSSRVWYKCGCGLWSIVEEPPWRPKEYDDIGAWHRRQKRQKRIR